MTLEWAVAGWFVLAGRYLIGGVGTFFASRWALRDRARARDVTWGVPVSGSAP